MPHRAISLDHINCSVNRFYVYFSSVVYVDVICRTLIRDGNNVGAIQLFVLHQFDDGKHEFLKSFRIIQVNLYL